MFFFSGPTVSSGRFGNAIFTPNNSTFDDNRILLGSHENDCLENVTLCPDGVTVSLWIYMFEQSHQWPAPVNGPLFFLFAYAGSPAGSPGPYIVVRLYNATHEWRKGRPLIYDYWIHFAFVYSAKDGFTLYSDGYRQDPLSPKPKSRKSVNLEMGCLGMKHCTKAKYDDLRVWNEAKDENFIWRLWQS